MNGWRTKKSPKSSQFQSRKDSLSFYNLSKFGNPCTSKINGTVIDDYTLFTGKLAILLNSGIFFQVVLANHCIMLISTITFLPCKINKQLMLQVTESLQLVTLIWT